MKNKLIIGFCILLASSCSNCKDDMVDNNVIWRTPLNQKSLIYDSGLGYPIYGNTVVFHSTPEPWGVQESILHGLDTKTGKEKWRLTNKDFYPKKSLRFDTFNYYYQNEKIVIGADFYDKDNYPESFFYAIDIDKGKVLWVKEFPEKGVRFGQVAIGRGAYAYVDFLNYTNEFSLIRVNIETGDFNEELKFTKENIPEDIPEKRVFFNQMSQIYTDNSGNEYVAICFGGFNYDINRNKLYLTLCVYNITEKRIVYTKYVNNRILEKDESDTFAGKIWYADGKLLVGQAKRIYCYDAFKDEGGPKWEHTTVLNDGIGFGSDNDNVSKVRVFENIGLVFCMDHLIGINMNTGKPIYHVEAAGGNDVAIIDGIIYQRESSDLQMRDPRTGKELKRVATPPNEQAFSSARPNGADGKIYIHSYTHAYCIKAWGK